MCRWCCCSCWDGDILATILGCNPFSSRCGRRCSRRRNRLFPNHRGNPARALHRDPKRPLVALPLWIPLRNPMPSRPPANPHCRPTQSARPWIGARRVSLRQRDRPRHRRIRALRRHQNHCANPARNRSRAGNGIRSRRRPASRRCLTWCSDDALSVWASSPVPRRSHPRPTATCWTTCATARPRPPRFRTLNAATELACRRGHRRMRKTCHE